MHIVTNAHVWMWPPYAMKCPSFSSIISASPVIVVYFSARAAAGEAGEALRARPGTGRRQPRPLRLAGGGGRVGAGGQPEEQPGLAAGAGAESEFRSLWVQVQLH
eukprot:SAG31_NODE_1803_length_7238_cov_3.273988_1_plen_104_part_10